MMMTVPKNIRKVSFKKRAMERGLASIACPHPDTTIKANGKSVGIISAPSRFGHERWKIGLMVTQDATIEDPGPWRWVYLKANFESEPEARQYVLAAWSKIENSFSVIDGED